MGDKKVDRLVQRDVKRNKRYPSINFDKLQMYFGYPYKIDIEGTEGSITLLQPSIGNIVEFGERRFYSNLNMFITNTSTYKVMLWDAGVDWNDISDFDLFIMLFQSGVDQEACDLIFENLDFSKFELLGKNIEVPGENEGDEPEIKQVPVLYDRENNIEINEEVYQHFHQYFQTMFQMFPEEKYTKDKMLKKWWVDSEKRDALRESQKKNDKQESSSMLAVISSCVNHPGFKYNLEQLKEVGVCQFYDSVKRLQVYESATACLKGLFSGFVSGKDIPPDEYNYMKEI